MFANEEFYTKANILGLTIRYIFLFLLGGFVAWLHQTENIPFKLVELGIAAPALITSFVATGANMDSRGTYIWPNNISIISSAYAEEATNEHNKIIMLAEGGFFKDLLDGVTGRAHTTQSKLERIRRDNEQSEIVIQESQTADEVEEPQETIEIEPSIPVEQVDQGKQTQEEQALKEQLALAKQRVEMARVRAQAARYQAEKADKIASELEVIYLTLQEKVDKKQSLPIVQSGTDL